MKICCFLFSFSDFKKTSGKLIFLTFWEGHGSRHLGPWPPQLTGNQLILAVEVGLFVSFLREHLHCTCVLIHLWQKSQEGRRTKRQEDTDPIKDFLNMFVGFLKVLLRVVYPTLICWRIVISMWRICICGYKYLMLAIFLLLLHVMLTLYYLLLYIIILFGWWAAGLANQILSLVNV